MNDKFTLKGNESFNIREGWLSKGTRCIAIDPDHSFFSRKDAMDMLGVGSKMVKSIRFWLRATGLVEECQHGNIRTQSLTQDLGEIIYQYDRYFEDIFTLWILHSQIVKNFNLCPTWFLYFNRFDAQEFSRDEMQLYLQNEFEKIVLKDSYSEKSFFDDCASVIRMYYSDEIEVKPEESTVSPFIELGLLTRGDFSKKRYIRQKPSIDKLDPLAVLYVLKQSMHNDTNSVKIEDLLNLDNSIGHTFQIDRALVNEYLDRLRIAGYVTINRTAGLDIVYVSPELTLKDILLAYYGQENR